MKVLETGAGVQVGQPGLVLQGWDGKVRAADGVPLFSEITLRHSRMIPASTTPGVPGISFYSLLSHGRGVWRGFKVPSHPTHSGTL